MRDTVLRHTAPVWAPKRGIYGSNLWEVYSPKISRNIMLYSDIEYHHWVKVEADPEIIAFCEQPIKMVEPIDGKMVESYVDMWDLFRDRHEEYREVKDWGSKDFENSDEVSEREKKQLEVQRRWCLKHGMQHRLITREDIYTNLVFLENWILILNTLIMSKDKPLQDVERYVIEFAASHKSFALRQAVEILARFSRKDVTAVVFRMLHRGWFSSSNIKNRRLDFNLEIDFCDDKVKNIFS